jgi:hypothetical protein
MPVSLSLTKSAHSPLKVTYSYIPGQGSGEPSVTAMVHGVCHSSDCFTDVAHELSEKGIGSVLVNLQSEHAGAIRRNLITLGNEMQGVDLALRTFQEQTGIQIRSICGHSKGTRVVDILQNAKPEWRLPTILMAPVPTYGISPMLARMAFRHPRMLAKTLTGELRNAMQSDEEILTLFGDAETPPEVIQKIRQQISHTSYLAYLQLLLPQWVRAHNHPVLLMMSGTDALFPPPSYRRLEKTYDNLRDVEIPGGHDFFMAHPQRTANHYATFHRTHAEGEKRA